MQDEAMQIIKEGENELPGSTCARREVGREKMCGEQYMSRPTSIKTRKAHQIPLMPCEAKRGHHHSTKIEKYKHKGKKTRE